MAPVYRLRKCQLLDAQHRVLAVVTAALTTAAADRCRAPTIQLEPDNRGFCEDRRSFVYRTDQADSQHEFSANRGIAFVQAESS